ncbi:aldo/keto reductase [Streptomyces sp. TRM68367]|uniref:aldo/keto reductase n=1 Tax=Streptomyces sp. TRM68367 TaxID=2758415 RepID=UPI0037DDB682
MTHPPCRDDGPNAPPGSRSRQPAADSVHLKRGEMAAVAAELGATPTQVALACLLDRSPVVLPIPGTACIDHLAENHATADLHLTPAHRDRLDRLVPDPS